MLLEDAEREYKQAARWLKQDDTPIQMRLKKACDHFLRLHRLDIPQEDLWTEHEGIKHMVTKVKKGRRGPNVEKTIQAMSSEEVQETAKRIIEMASRIEEVRRAQVHRVQKVG